MNVARIMSMFAIFVLLAVVASTAQSNRPSQTFDTSSGPVKVTPLYHATMLIEAGGKNIYVDPVKPANFSGLPKADLILITDIHGDHMDSEAIAAISKSLRRRPWSQRSRRPPLSPTAKPNHGPAGRSKRSPCTT
jgi:Beta-lactamase superfamily domain